LLTIGSLSTVLRHSQAHFKILHFLIKQSKYYRLILHCSIRLTVITMYLDLSMVLRIGFNVKLIVLRSIQIQDLTWVALSMEWEWLPKVVHLGLKLATQVLISPTS
jgi:hypothetical protein